MKKMKKLATALLALSCIFAVGGLTACEDDGKSSSSSSTGIEVELDKLAVTMKVGDKEQIEATVVGAEGVTYSSSNTAVATVDQEGNITAVGLGKAEITATSGGVTAVCKVTVINIAVTDVAFRYEEVSVSIGSQKALNAIITPLIATNKEVTFTSSAPEIATVDTKGVVTGVAEGETTVTVTTADGGKTATCSVKVGKAVESIAFDVQEITLIATRTQKINATIAPSDAIIQDIVWSSSNTKVAAVAGGEVFGIGAGTAVITATTVDGEKVATCNVTVEPYVNIVSVALDKEIANVASGGTLQLQATVNPDNATEQGLQWISSDTNVVRVDQNGLVTGYGEGTATITVVSKKNETLTDSVEINVIAAATTFYNEYYTPTGDFTFTAYNVNEVKFNGTALVAGEYTYADNVVTVAKSTLIGKSTTAANTLTLVSAESGNADVSVKILKAALTNFDETDLGAEIFDNCTNVGEMTQADGKLTIKAIAGESKSELNFNVEYLKAMFAYPDLSVLRVRLSTEGVNGGNLYYSTRKTDDTIAHYGTSVNSTRNIDFTRAIFNQLVENEAQDAESVKSNLALFLNSANVGADTKFVVDRVWAPRADNDDFNANTARVNAIYADAQLVEAKGLPITLSTDAQATSLKLSGTEFIAKEQHAQVGNIVTVAASRINGAIRTKAPLILATAYSQEIYNLNTKAFIDDSQFVEVGDGITGEYLFPFVLKTGEKVVSATFNGVAVAPEKITAEGIKLDKTALRASLGMNALEIKVERIVDVAPIRYTAVDTYYRGVYVTENLNALYNNAVTFEDGTLSPFVFVLGTSSIIDSKVISDEATSTTAYKVDYQSTTAENGRYYTDSTNQNAKIANMKVLKVEANAKVYVSTSWIKKRVEALGYDATSFTGNLKLLWRVIRPEGGSGGGTTSTYSGAANNDLWEYLYGNSNANGSTECVTLASAAQYAKMGVADAPEYVEFAFTRPKYIDDLGANITDKRFVNAEGVDSVLSVKLI